MILCCPNNVVWIAIFAVLCEIAPLSFPGQSSGPAHQTHMGCAKMRPRQTPLAMEHDLPDLPVQRVREEALDFNDTTCRQEKCQCQESRCCPFIAFVDFEFWHIETLLFWRSTTVSTQPRVYKWVGKMEFNDFKPWCAHWPARSLHIGRTDTTKKCIMEDVKSVESHTESGKLSKWYTLSEHGSQGSPSQDEKSEERLLLEDQNAQRNSENQIKRHGGSSSLQPRSPGLHPRWRGQWMRRSSRSRTTSWHGVWWCSVRNGRKAIVDAKGEMWRFMSLYER